VRSKVVFVTNGSDYTYVPANTHVHWYLIALPHSATHSVTASLEHQRTGRLGVWPCYSVSVVVLMLAKWPCCASRVVNSRV